MGKTTVSILDYLDIGELDMPSEGDLVGRPRIVRVSRRSAFDELILTDRVSICMSDSSYKNLREKFIEYFGGDTISEREAGDTFDKMTRVKRHELPPFDQYHTPFLPLWKNGDTRPLTLVGFNRIQIVAEQRLKHYGETLTRWITAWGLDVVNPFRDLREVRSVGSIDLLGKHDIVHYFHKKTGGLVYTEISHDAVYHFPDGEIHRF